MSREPRGVLFHIQQKNIITVNINSQNRSWWGNSQGCQLTRSRRLDEREFATMELASTSPHTTCVQRFFPEMRYNFTSAQFFPERRSTSPHLLRHERENSFCFWIHFKRQNCVKLANTTCHHSNRRVSVHLLVSFKIVCLTSLSKYMASITGY